MALTFIGAEHSDSSASSSATCNKPAGTADDDILFAFVRRATVATAPSTVPAGWTLLGDSGAISADGAMWLYWKLAASEGASYTWEWAAAALVGVTIVAYRGGFDTSSPIDVVSNTQYTVSNFLVRAASMTVTNPASPAVFFGGYDFSSAGSLTPPALFTEDVDREGVFAGSRFMRAVSRSVLGAGATGTMEGTIAASVAVKHAFAVALNPGPIDVVERVVRPGGFRNFPALATSFEAGRVSLNSFCKTVPSAATVTGQWFDYSYAGGNPPANYYASAPLIAATLNPDRGLRVARLESGEKQFLHRFTTMCAAASATSTTAQNQALILMDYLLYYPFIDFDSAENQSLENLVELPRYEDGVGVQMMLVAQSPTAAGGGRFIVTYTDTEDNSQVSPTVYCAAGQPAGAVQTATGAMAGINPFVPLNAGVRGVKSVQSVLPTVLNGGLAALVLVKPLLMHKVNEECRRLTSGTFESYGDAIQHEAWSISSAMPEILDGAFLSFISNGRSGSLALSSIAGILETVRG